MTARLPPPSKILQLRGAKLTRAVEALEPGNVQWATAIGQSNNTRRNRVLVIGARGLGGGVPGARGEAEEADEEGCLTRSRIPAQPAPRAEAQPHAGAAQAVSGGAPEGARASRVECFLRHVSPEPTSGCWLWVGSLSKGRGYGQFNLAGRPTTAHRAAWILFQGPVPAAALVCHRCDNRACVNPEHLFLGTAQDNTDDMFKKGRERPPRGEACGTAKLSAPDVLAMRRLRLGGLTYAEIAAAYGVHPVTAMRAIKGEQWGHLL